MIEEIMADNTTIQNLKKRKDEIKDEMEFSGETKPLSDELYEINDTLTKLGANDETTRHIS